MSIDCKNIKEVNEDLSKTKKLLISVGCSFTEGTSAWDMRLIEKYPPDYYSRQYGFDHYSTDIKKQIEKEFVGVKYREADNSLDLTRMVKNNSFVSVLANRYYNEQYTPLNFGNQSNGNMAAVSRLFMYPIDYHLAEEIVVIFCPTGLQRFDFIRDDTFGSSIFIGNDFRTVWPYHAINSGKDDKFWGQLHNGYRECVWSRRFEILNAISAMTLIDKWCKLHNAKLIIFPAFDREYNIVDFKKLLTQKLTRDNDTNLHTGTIKITDEFEFDFIEHLLSLVPWNNFFKPRGAPTFHDLALRQEPSLSSDMTMYDITSKKQITPNSWIMACGHPSAKAHALLAKELYNFLERHQ